jgi:carbonic anhydrase
LVSPEEFIIKATGHLAAASALLSLAVLVASSEDEPAITAQQALQKLLEGNARFVQERAAHPHQSAERRAEVLSGQNPFAVILGCSDSRIPPEIIFDQGIGDLFIVRTAGQVVDDVALGSIEYAVEHLGVPLVMVLGHDKCGAITATIAGGEASGHIGSLVAALNPAVEKAKKMGGEDQLLNNSIDENVRMITHQLRSSKPLLSKLVEEGKLQIVGARYHLDSGRVDILE